MLRAPTWITSATSAVRATSAGVEHLRDDEEPVAPRDAPEDLEAARAEAAERVGRRARLEGAGAEQRHAEPREALGGAVERRLVLDGARAGGEDERLAGADAQARSELDGARLALRAGEARVRSGSASITSTTLASREAASNDLAGRVRDLERRAASQHLRGLHLGARADQLLRPRARGVLVLHDEDHDAAPFQATSATVPRKNRTARTPLTVKNAAPTRERSRGVTSACSTARRSAAATTEAA